MSTTFNIGSREFFLGGATQEGFVIKLSHELRNIAPSVSADLLNIAENSSRLHAEVGALRWRAKSLEQCRMEYFVANWPL